MLARFHPLFCPFLVHCASAPILLSFCGSPIVLGGGLVLFWAMFQVFVVKLLFWALVRRNQISSPKWLGLSGRDKRLGLLGRDAGLQLKYRLYMKKNFKNFIWGGGGWSKSFVFLCFTPLPPPTSTNTTISYSLSLLHPHINLLT